MRFASSKLLKIETALVQKPSDSTPVDALAFGLSVLASRSCEAAKAGGGERDRTDNLLLAKQALSQLSYTPESWWVWLDSNQRPPPYQDGALTGRATDPRRGSS